MSEHIAETTTQGVADTTSAPSSSPDPGSEEGAREVLDEHSAAPVTGLDATEPSAWLPWDVT